MRRGFTLLELAMVVVISGVMLGFILQTNSVANNADCYVSTKVQLNVIRNAIEVFARKNDRLPLPAARNVGVEDVTYGRESSGANIDAAGGASWGAVPFQALGLPTSYAGDCWGNKFTYVVTTALTTNSSSGGFKDSFVLGNITQKSTATLNFSTTTAYAIISHGQDGLGAVKLNYRAANTVGSPDPAHGWCTGTDFKNLNCLATGATIAGGVYNDGTDAAANYFDDLVVAAGKPQVLDPERYLYCWGNDQYGNSSVGTSYFSTYPTHVYGTGPGGVALFNIVGENSQLSYGFYCALTSTGAAYCWGSNDSGQLGVGDTQDRGRPVAVQGGLRFSKLYASRVSAGSSGDYICGITTANEAYCWGSNTAGQLGDGTTTNRSVPTAVSGGLSFSEIIMPTGNYADGYTCGLTTLGKVYCWGGNVGGQLGDGTTTTSLVPVPLAAPNPTFATVRASARAACGITNTNDLYCWGTNSYGQLGLGDTTSRSAPTLVGSNYTTVALGPMGDMCAINTSGDAYCTGYNAYGELGVGDTANRTSLTAVLGGYKFTRITSFGMNTTNPGYCAATTAGKNYCWGAGYLGVGDTARHTSPTALATTVPITLIEDNYGSMMCGLDPSGVMYCWGNNAGCYFGIGAGACGAVNSPIAIGGHIFTSTSGGSTNHCATTADGSVYCWGQGGQIGSGGILGRGYIRSIRTAAPGSRGQRFVSVVAGQYASCGLDSAGAAYCWGGLAQYLGTGNTNPYSDTDTPIAVTGGLTFKALGAASNAFCGITTGGDAYCWGLDSNGQLGDGVVGSPSTQYSPALVSGGLKYSTIGSGGRYHFCAITTGGAAYCWGYNGYGQLGDTTTTTRAAPTAVSGGLTFTKIYTGYQYSCGLIASGAAYCWGENGKGQLGDNTTVDKSTPTAVSGGLTFTRLALGSSTTCGVTSSGAAYCWGNNNVGQIGDGTTLNKSVPTAVSGGLSFTDITNSTYRSIPEYPTVCGTTSTGQVYCWGQGSYYQLGNNGTANSSVPTLVTGTGSGTMVIDSLMHSGSYQLFCGLAKPTAGQCILPWGGYIADGAFVTGYQAAAPTGECKAETRTCTAGVLSGSYISGTCTPGCPAQIAYWPGTGSTVCSVSVGALAGGGSTAISSTEPGTTGAATANCSTTGVLTLSGTSCAP